MKHRIAKSLKRAGDEWPLILDTFLSCLHSHLICCGLLHCIKTGINLLQGPTPWKQIICSRPVWLNVVGQWGGIWGLFTLMTQAPTYFKIVHGWNIGMTGILSGFPHLMRMIFAYLFSMLGDYLLSSNKMSRTNVRKLAGTFCCTINGIFIIGLAYSGCNSYLAVMFLTLATAVHGAVSTGPLASLVDLSPNFSGITLGLVGMVSVLPGFISPIIVGHLTFGNVIIIMIFFFSFIIKFFFLANYSTVALCIFNSLWYANILWYIICATCQICIANMEQSTNKIKNIPRKWRKD